MPDVSRLRELLAEGTPGSWVDRGKGGIGDRILRPCVHGSTAPVPANDAALIVAAVNALPKLLDVVEAAPDIPDVIDPEHKRLDLVVLPRFRAALASLETET